MDAINIPVSHGVLRQRMILISRLFKKGIAFLSIFFAMLLVPQRPHALSFQERPTITLDDTARDYMWVTGKTLDETNGTLHPYIREVITASNIFKR